MNPRYEKICKEIEKNRAKMSELQGRQRDLERQKTELENSEIVAAFRATNVSPQELAEYIKAFQQNGIPGAVSTPVQPPPAPPLKPDALTTNQEEIDIETE